MGGLCVFWESPIIYLDCLHCRVTHLGDGSVLDLRRRLEPVVPPGFPLGVTYLRASQDTVEPLALA